MAQQVVWSEFEWALLVDLIWRYEDEVPEAEIERVHHVLRAAAVTSEDPKRRRQATDPSFRSRGGVWAQYYLARRTRGREQRRQAPARLREIWQRFDQDPEFVARMAEEFRARIVRTGNPYGVTDSAALRLFIIDVTALLGDSVELTRAMPASRLSDDLAVLHSAAWNDLKERGVVDSIFDELERPDTGRRLEGAGLTGVHLGFKLTGWFEALTEWREARTVDALRRAFRWANVVLGSLGKVVADLGLDIFKEFKDSTEAVLDEAIPPGGYLPAPALA